MTTPKDTDRRTTDRRENEERRSDAFRAAAGERRVIEQRGMVAAMGDALEDILRWERASERAMRIAEPKGASVPESTSH